jgi:hypothetical protein
VSNQENQRPTFLLRLRPEPHVTDPFRALRGLLKAHYDALACVAPAAKYRTKLQKLLKSFAMMSQGARRATAVKTDDTGARP